ncbi:conserved hypothetical protein [Hyella patelloides LEGE 07179]|uniref:Right handed beta helix domain-containing protein n=1 Tax=Hyella patelloides LEGE 07179 TaxID=945734 RepID=A0A563VTU9_9CYAN|nr:right-handed parallel beta-helix repeat-containing protein [Hyella patelloides]VEP14691.1 conserved hypothetical protein [Hyella patelloides LEGE 07179]
MAIITVTNNDNEGNGSLRSAIATAQSGDTIKFSSSLANQTITLDNFIRIPKSLTIDGSDAPGLTISGGEKTNIFRLPEENKSLTVRNLTLADSYHETDVGGAIWATENSTINIENTNFLNHVSKGAALHGLEGTVITVSNSTFDNNDGTLFSDRPFSAGAISLFAYGSLTVKNSIFTNNKGYSGAALRVTASDLIVEDSLFMDNDSTLGADQNFLEVPGGGGAIYLDGASVPNDPRFYEGELERETEGGVFSVRNSRFENNRAAGEGGAILAYGYNQDQVIIKDSEIINNEVIENVRGIAQGGAIRASGFVEIDNTTIANNKSANLGGGLYILGEVPAEISNSTFANNQAVDGGAIYNGLWGSKIEINNTSFDSNSATNEAGVFFNKNKISVTFQDSQFANNTPDNINDVSFDSSIPDIVYGTNSSDTIVGRDQNSYLVGFNSNDTIEGRGGNDYLDGGNNDDTLFGGDGNDTLIGGNGTNSLVGGDGNDIFLGGNGRDVIQGGGGRDRFIIGDENSIFYNNYRWFDNAIITDFQPEQDIIQLKGQASDYTTRSFSNQEISGTGIFYDDGMVALIEDISPSDFSLNANYVDYVGNNNLTNNSQIELTQNSSFSGQPDYNPAEHYGLIIWNTDDTWHIEATGDLDGSRFTGRIIADNSLEDLSPYQVEGNDLVEFADNSNQILEFDLNVWDKWTDGLSFKVTDETSLFLDLDDSSDISIKAGLNLENIT